MKVYAFEWQYCIYESSMAVVSLHATKLGAFKAMTQEANHRWLKEREFMKRIKRIKGWEPLKLERWRIATYEVQEGAK